MCGIAGLVGLDRTIAEPRVREALRRLQHRGPDGEGLYLGATAVLGMRRLAIIDLAHGDQPIYNEDRSVAVVCNGELYNYREEFAALIARGHRLQSGSDVNLLPHLYEEAGADAFQACRGMFAAAIWDERKRRLVLGRDRVGKKPLFWARVGAEGLAFASELPALLALLDDTPAFSNDAIAAYLQLGYVPHPDTIYQGLQALPPGCSLSLHLGEPPQITPYWEPRVPTEYRGTRDQALAELDERLREAVELRLRSDVPVGLFLSGGVDSGLVAAYASSLSARDLLCFVVEVPDSGLNEAPDARRVAQHLGLPIETITLEMAPSKIVERIPQLYGQPFGDSSAVPSYLLARAAGARRKVVLNGDGGDEIFAGYRRYWLGRAAPLLATLARPFRAPIAAAGDRLAQAAARRSGLGFTARALRGLAVPDQSRYLRWTGDLLDAADIVRLFPELGTGEPPLARLARLRGRAVSTHGLRAFQLSDYQLNLADDLLVKMDIATMANSLEGRSPLLDVPLAEFAWSLPEAWLISARETKPMLRALARRMLPAEIGAAAKRGFEVPVRDWLRGELSELVNDTLLAPDSKVASLGDVRAIRAFVRGTDRFPGNHTQAVWSLLMLELFLRAPTPAPAHRLGVA